MFFRHVMVFNFVFIIFTCVLIHSNAQNTHFDFSRLFHFSCFFSCFLISQISFFPSFLPACRHYALCPNPIIQFTCKSGTSDVFVNLFLRGAEMEGRDGQRGTDRWMEGKLDRGEGVVGGNLITKKMKKDINKN